MACSEGARALAEKCARLAPPLADVEAFARAPSPDAATIDQAARAFDDMSSRQRIVKEKAQAARDGLAAARKSLLTLERQGPIASIEALRQARQDRDQEWTLLRAFLLSGPAAPRLDETSRAEKTKGFETLSTEADRCADVLLANSARVAAADAEREKIVAATRDLVEAEQAQAELAQERAKSERDWAEAWRASGLSPLAPRLMGVWRERADSLLEAREILLRQQAKARQWEGSLARARPDLEALAMECGLPPMQTLDCAALARRIEARLAELAEARDAAREAQAKIADAPARIARLKERLGQLAEEQAQWRAQWRVALAALRLDADAGFDAAQKRIALWRALPGEFLGESDKAERARKIAEDMAGFEQKLDGLLALCARDASSRPVERAVAQLRQRLTRAREKAALRDKARERLALAEAEANRVGAELAGAEAALQGLCVEAEQAGLGGDPDNWLRRLDAREQLGLAIKAERDRLFLVAEGFDETILANEAENFDPDAARIRLDEIDRQLKADEDRAREIYAELRARENELSRLQTSLGAEAAIQARENARAEILQQSRRWAVLKLASLLVNAGLERSRDRRKDPLLARAGALFGLLTEGRYAGLDQAFGEDDSLQLRARRVDGAELELSALSEGARDQLYLALRLAFLEDYAARSEAPPFIGDDLFASFDDSRLAAGLHTLEQASAAIQPIIFTHHAHIVRLARDRLGDAAQILRLD